MDSGLLESARIGREYEGARSVTEGAIEVALEEGTRRGTGSASIGMCTGSLFLNLLRFGALETEWSDLENFE